jgi:hypothetical protein
MPKQRPRDEDWEVFCSSGAARSGGRVRVWRIRIVGGGGIRVKPRKHQAVALAKELAAKDGVSAWLREGPLLERTYTKLPD